ncbi:uncharacterized protein LOC127799249 isoform X7 [Diospyros lotus]|uniref:uncharacterized protein LOC127799249 isoform X1 n=1 Tax=Diospyros lotus TaxID=55363 RepID=UPI0022581B59|nr:uncharacterized protein LOC127799249 isoform X1 [Diospyros lotus]XP_052189058.1 uncharacterized protein LOC127799249 isoform X2 [Diospyros lotus]XP_052189059.1 uncharacterized protein LOC127799249 isoform X3 [Diospyros lotus]XP_052189060.1 uncharacterized protein LOC127799249 isoform X4 [Diospyros lotus]XP_052189061.1 uncharacterized protein LOC127799249 isoform X5 [Diospyros lotus]XP_052189062.1 uncharacterized protein LOC127799249 isoform X6 [Diospyros lotus]XP_052189063.1 uncharacterize
MSLRQAAFGLLRKLRHSPQIPTATVIRTAKTRQTGKIYFSCYGFGQYTWKRPLGEAYLWIFLSGQAAVLLGINCRTAFAEDASINLSSEDNMQEGNLTGLRKIQDGSVVSNIHTSKWRVFTDKGRDYFLQGKLEEAERLFLSALQEAKEGFGEKDAHVASACNNLAELYRVKKAFDKAEPLYLEAVKILEVSFGSEDVRVAAALHNLGQLYLVQRKLQEARMCYERALKIKRGVLGHGHVDYADTMYHLGTVLYLQGDEKDAETLIQDSVMILEEGGLGESNICLRRRCHLAQIYIKSNRLAEGENVQRKILHAMELTKGWNSLDTVLAAEGLCLTLQSLGNLTEAKDLLERCLEARKTILPEDHIQVAANMLYIARVQMLSLNQQRKLDTSETIDELNKAKDLLGHSIRIAQQALYKSAKEENKLKHYRVSRQTRKDEHAALVILLQSLNALGLLEINEQELLESMGERSAAVGAENAYGQCISSFKEFGVGRMASSPEIKAEYLSCLKRLSSLIGDGSTDSMQQSRKATLQELKDEIKHIEAELPNKGEHKN